MQSFYSFVVYNYTKGNNSQLQTAMDKEFIEIKNKTLKICVCITTFKEDDLWIAFSPSLNISAYGSTEKDALKSLNVTFDLHFEWVIKNKTLQEDLKKLGWLQTKPVSLFNKIIPETHLKSHIPFKHSYALT